MYYDYYDYYDYYYCFFCLLFIPVSLPALLQTAIRHKKNFVSNGGLLRLLLLPWNHQNINEKTRKPKIPLPHNIVLKPHPHEHYDYYYYYHCYYHGTIRTSTKKQGNQKFR